MAIAKTVWFLSSPLGVIAIVSTLCSMAHAQSLFVLDTESRIPTIFPAWHAASKSDISTVVEASVETELSVVDPYSSRHVSVDSLEHRVANATPRQVDAILELAFSQHPELSAGTASVDREAGLRHQSTRWPNPIFGYMASEIGQAGNSGQQGAYWSQEWVTAGKLGLADQVGQWRMVAATASLETRRMRLARRVQSQYWMLVAAQQRVTLLSQMEQLLDEAVRTNQALMEAAEIGRGTLLQAKIERNQISVAMRQAQADSQAKLSMLATTIGVATDHLNGLEHDPWPSNEQAPGVIQGDVFSFGSAERPTTIGSAERSATLGSAERSTTMFGSPELEEARALLEVAMSECRLAEVQIRSNIQSQTSLQHDALSRDLIVGVQIGLAVPVTDRKSGLVQAARAEVTRARANLEALERNLQARMAEAVGQYQSANEMVQAIDADLLTLARERLDLARQAHQQGESDYLELLTAQRSYLTVLQTALDAHEQAALARARLQTFAVDD